jgi:hypothetical protein
MVWYFSFSGYRQDSAGLEFISGISEGKFAVFAGRSQKEKEKREEAERCGKKTDGTAREGSGNPLPGRGAKLSCL